MDTLPFLLSPPRGDSAMGFIRLRAEAIIAAFAEIEATLLPGRAGGQDDLVVTFPVGLPARYDGRRYEELVRELNATAGLRDAVAAVLRERYGEAV